ncbi:D-alanine--D-alanine ligase [Allohahella sp. A8]|uniref:D-alanine--D-alanine ligase n=1 Tax=Allohahella sp. A8 TaxID=3141461 RepID=UPI000C0B5176|nr:D-alanine--D-alanine ligase [Hahellaceae bacterium]|tara:strand:- start:55962 stop:57149 length:1188 start_codon:yes stop_codon:yes gene_type:complete
MSHFERDLDPAAAPPMKASIRTLSVYEFWSPALFYLPVKAYALWLALRYRGITLPTVANPTFDLGGFVGESKLQILDLLPPSLGGLLLSHTRIARSGMTEEDISDDARIALSRVHARGFDFPFVAKPDKGSRGAGVRRVYDQPALQRYLAEFPVQDTVVLQALEDLPYEAGIFYIRLPENDPGGWFDPATGHSTEGEIFSVTLKVFPYVTGDGQRTLRQLIQQDPRAGRLAHLYLPRHTERLEQVLPAGERFRLAFAGSHARGCIFRDGSHLVTPAFRRQWDLIARQIPGFYFGRFDIRFDDVRKLSCVASLEDLQHLEGVKIIEVNGAGAEATHIWDADMPIRRAYGTLFDQYRKLFAIGAAQRRLGHPVPGLRKVWAEIQQNETMATRYPLTE